jgi:polyisoprenoid-binding protein YceI
METTMNTTTTDRTDLSAGTWRIDPGHADVGFVGRHFGLTKIRGRFTGVDGTITLADPIEGSSVDVTIDMTTVDSGDRTRDDHLRSVDLFDVEHHPTARFRSASVMVAEGAGRLPGELTIKDVTRPVELDVTFLGRVTDPWDNDRLVFSASGLINREDWGLTWNMPLGAGGWLVSKEIRLEIEVELLPTR